ncbi:MAG: winged helix DNA-binding domain-containing protein [Corynebacterium sp.]|uniref:winged helix DNA-binding domain-containing protein n=1 Tax=Corynebacterium sp. TaxID=1720 RepID=UPI003F9B2327
MVNPALVEARLVAQGLVNPTADSPHQVLSTMGPMQGQDLTGVMSSIALRVSGGSYDEVTEAFNDGHLVRGYPMRSTVFAMAAGDARWITELCAGQQRRESGRRMEQLGLTASDVNTAHDLLAEHPTGMSRKEAGELWVRHELPDDNGFRYLMIRDMMLHGTAVYGPFRGADQLIVAAEGWLPDGDLESRFNGDRTAATAELLRRYLHGHGPADLRDFAWWTKLPQKLIKDAAGDITDVEERDGRLHRPGLPDEIAALKKKAHGTFLLPAFDEIVLGYRDRLAFMTDDHHEQVAPGNRGVFRKTVVRGGKLIATWTAPKSGPKKPTRVTPEPFRPLSAAAEKDITRAFRRFPLQR